MEARIKLGLKRFAEAEEDDFGNPVGGLADPVEILVFSVGPLYSNENEQQVQTGITVGTPHHYDITPQDVIVFNGKDYTVEGELTDCNWGPWDYKPGYVINAKRSDR